MASAPPSSREAHKALAASQFARLGVATRIIVAAIAIALMLRTVAYEPFNVPSASMLPTLAAGDYLFVAKWPYGLSRYSPPVTLPWGEGRFGGHPPSRGDVVVFKSPRDNRTDFIKRIIGLPGDRVRMTGGRIELNGVVVAKVAAGSQRVTLPAGVVCRAPDGDGCRSPRFAETLAGHRYLVLDQVSGGPGDDTPLVTVPPGHYFVAGDNRDDSADSRLAIADGGIGMVPAANLLGRAEIIFFSMSSWRFDFDRVGTPL